jgi:hypothetical protein
MTRAITTSATALLLLLSPVILKAQHHAPAPNTGPSMEETLAFIRDALSNSGTVRSMWSSRDGQTQRVATVGTVALDAVDGCKLAFKQTFQFVPQPMTVSRLSVDLSDLDPMSANVSAPQTYSDQNGTITYPYVIVTIASRNFAKVVTFVAANGSSQSMSNLSLAVDTQGIGVRLANAFTHAIQLCGGKKSAF